ncbi:MAG: LlaJI family restriction endonuclease [Ruminococcus sp.]|nr:LlaJI family restriction endonuclease [Ruminococcus sp.]
MISRFVKEQKRYTREELRDILSESADNLISNVDLIRIIKRLKEYGVLKTVKYGNKQLEMSDLVEEDVEVVDEEDTGKKHLYVFTFVGIIIVESRVLKCYPKYIFKTVQPASELKQIIKVLRKYNSKEQIIRMYNEGGKVTLFNRLAAMVYLMNDYHENGIYTNDEQIIETNGSGEIVWDRTINYTYPILQNGAPYYFELQTKRRVVNDYDFIKRLHEVLLTECSRELKTSDLLDIMDLTEVILSDDRLSDIGDSEYLLYRIASEINVQFNTRKQTLLGVMQALISNKGSLEDFDSFSMYGSNSFNLVWEKVCSEVLNSKLGTKLSDIEMEYHFTLKDDYSSKKDNTLKELIEKPKWTLYGLDDENDITAEAGDTLIPDLISLRRTGAEIEFDIFDAKYYVAEISPGRVKGQPGIDSIIKQYMYHLAYKDFLEKHNIHKVNNCFLMPTEENSLQKTLDVHLEMIDALQLARIKARRLSAMRMYAHYLSSRHIDIDELEL